MDCLIGLQTRDFVLLAANANLARSIVQLSNDHDKHTRVGDFVSIASCGEDGDRVQFTELIAKNISLYKMRNGYQLSPMGVANFTRKQIADSLRSRDAYMVNMLIGGYDETEGPSLYYLDYLGTMKKLPFGIHGYGAHFLLSLFDRYYRNDLTVDEALEIIKRCLGQLDTRFIIATKQFKVRVISKDGMRDTVITL